ncbi:hypothetical protein ACLOJK_012672 [Asimina triloba]
MQIEDPVEQPENAARAVGAKPIEPDVWSISGNIPHTVFFDRISAFGWKATQRLHAQFNNDLEELAHQLSAKTRLETKELRAMNL